MSIWKKSNNPKSSAYVRFEVKEDGTRGRPKFTSSKDVPALIKRELDGGAEAVDDTDMSLDTADKGCVFCGAWSKLTRMLDGHTIYLCDEHYYSKNLGQVAQQVRETNSVPA